MKSIKQLFIILIFSFVYLYGAFGQENNNFRNAYKVSMGIVQFNNVPGFAFQNEYCRELTSFVSVAAKFTFSMATDKYSNAPFQHQAMSSFNFSLYFTPLNTENHKILFGGGVGYNYYQLTQNNFLYKVGPVTYFDVMKYNKGMGFNLIAGYEFTINDRYILGFHETAITFDDLLVNFGFNVGYKF